MERMGTFICASPRLSLFACKRNKLATLIKKFEQKCFVTPPSRRALENNGFTFTVKKEQICTPTGHGALQNDGLTFSLRNVNENGRKIRTHKRKVVRNSLVQIDMEHDGKYDDDIVAEVAD